MDAVKNALGTLEAEKERLASQLNEVITAINALKPLVNQEPMLTRPLVVDKADTESSYVVRWDAWVEEDDKTLAEICFLCSNDPNISQKQMLQYASETLHRTPGACGYRWYRKVKPRLSDFIPELNPTA